MSSSPETEKIAAVLIEKFHLIQTIGENRGKLLADKNVQKHISKWVPQYFIQYWIQASPDMGQESP